MAAADLPRRRRSHLRVAAAASGLLILLFVGGFALFLADVASFRSLPADRRADGIVVLTGGHARVDEAVRLLDDGKGTRLLISGVHPSTSRATLARAFGLDTAQLACCVDIDHAALDTIGNAAETARWANKYGFDSLIVVTNDYHMPRSLLEMRHAMNNVHLIPHAVVSDVQGETGFSKALNRYRVLLGEYAKYGVALVRTAVTPGPGDTARAGVLTQSD